MIKLTVGLDPKLERWFQRKFNTPTEVQYDAVRHVLTGQSILISSPTGSGKTLAAFLGIFNHLIQLRKTDSWGDRIGAPTVLSFPVFRIGLRVQPGMIG
jgi:ATP-dependent Lhr-like helicase